MENSITRRAGNPIGPRRSHPSRRLVAPITNRATVDPLPRPAGDRLRALAESASSERARSRRGYLLAKRALDVVLAAGGLVALSPVLAAAALAVKLDSPGPVLFRQERLGRAGRPFRILKFRSMRSGSAGLAVTAGGDPRITRTGALLRKTKLDELPQLWNVLGGEMSLVGPRPEVERYAALFPDAYAKVLGVRPGLTDFAAVEYRDEEKVLAGAADPEKAYLEEVLPKKMALYRRYLDEMSLATDLKLILQTLAALFR